ncbi:MAG TPA: hypothetical protein VL972_08010 [Solirubrobacteraceae bacterium]|nr:hypothetical protein [Solirubrobacteraceae bacterium]
MTCPSRPRRALLALIALPAVLLAGCANTVQDQPIPHNTLEALLLAPYPVYWLGGTFHGMAITAAGGDPGGAFTIQYGDCLEGGQSTCVPPLKIVTSPDNSFVPGQRSPTSRTALLRGVPATLTEAGAAIAIATGPVVLSVFAKTPALARAAAETAVPVNYPSYPGAPLAQPLPNTGFDERPLPSQMPAPLRPLRQ